MNFSNFFIKKFLIEIVLLIDDLLHLDYSNISN